MMYVMYMHDIHVRIMYLMIARLGSKEKMNDELALILDSRC